MSKKVAIAVLHGVGTYAPVDVRRSDEPSYSRELKSRIMQTLPQEAMAVFRDQVAWREVHYSQVFQSIQAEFLAGVQKQVRSGFARRLVVRNIGDAAAYRADCTAYNGLAYQRVHDCIARTLGALEADVGPDAPLIILAHSLGGFVVSNYLWDAQKTPVALSSFQRGRSLCALITFGCNIPLFLLGLPRDKVKALAFPGVRCDPRIVEPAWWLNFYDRDDPLGYPLGQWGRGYEDLFATGALVDHSINVGKFWKRWNLLSHNSYWSGREFVDPVADRVLHALKRTCEFSQSLTET